MQTHEKVLYVRLSPSLHNRLKVAAAKRDRPMSELARAAVERYLEETERSDG